MYTEELIKTIAKKSNIDISEFDINELIMGMAVELEHGSVNDKTDVTGDDPESTFKIVMAHMHEMPDYYTKLKAMEGKKENISEYARRMRELTGLSEGNQKKSIKTIQEGASDFENGQTFYAKDMMTSNGYKSYTNSEGDKIYDLSKEFNIGPTSIEHFIELAKENDKLYSFLNSELSSNEGVDTGNNIFWGSDIFDHIKNEPRTSIAESEEKEDFETYKFEQKTIEEGDDDQELYSLNENTIIVLDFLNEKITPAQQKYVDKAKKNSEKTKPTQEKTQFRKDIVSAKRMINAGKSGKDVINKYGIDVLNAVNAENEYK